MQEKIDLFIECFELILKTFDSPFKKNMTSKIYLQGSQLKKFTHISIMVVRNQWWTIGYTSYNLWTFFYTSNKILRGSTV